MKDYLEEVGDNRLIGISKVDAMCAEIDSGSVDKIGCGVMIIM